MSCSQKEPRVRIPNSPPKTQSYQGFCPYDWAFLFSQGHIGVHDFRQELRCASRSALYPAESGYCPLHSPEIDRIILVTGADKIEYCQKEIIEKYGSKKTVSVCAGGRERYESVWKALQTLKSLESEQEQKTDYVLIHDGARPFLNQEMLERLCACVKEEKACVLGMPVKDTIKLTDENGKIRESPRRDLVWQAQTPQAFAAELLFPAFEKLMQHSTEGITDDAMVVEQEMGIASVMVKGGYENIKITTPEDLLVAESFLAEK